MPALNESTTSADVVREIEIGGATVQITARQIGDGWFGIWKCRCCGQSAVNGVVYHTAAMALDLTAENFALQRCACTAGKSVRPFSSTPRSV